MNRHALLFKKGLATNPVFATQLINDYVNSKSLNYLTHAQTLFDQVPQKDTYLWNALISAYARSNYIHKALQNFLTLHHQSDPTHRPNQFIYSTVACAIASSTEISVQFRQCLHAHVLKTGFLPDHVVVGTAFLDMYAKHGVIGCARVLFDEMSQRNLVTWNAMIAGYVQNGLESEGLILFYQMKCRELLAPDEFSSATVLAACSSVQNLTLGMQLHGYLIIKGFLLDCLYSLCNMYIQCGQVLHAESVCDGVERDIILNLIKIRGYVLNHRYDKAYNYFVVRPNAMEVLGADRSMIVPLLTICAKLGLIRVGSQVHCLLITWDKFNKFYLSEDDDAIIGSALIDMYSKCHSVAAARNVFDSWTPFPQICHWNSMINGYVFNGLIEEARALYEEMPEKSVVSFTTVSKGYVQNAMPEEALDLLAGVYANMDAIRVEGNSYTFVVGLEACSQLCDLVRGRQIHAKLIRSSGDTNTSQVIVKTALIDMYCKAGKLDFAQTIFDSMLEKNVVAWTSIISGYALHGVGSRALEMFRKMIHAGMEPNEITFVSVLTACSHCGLIEEGLQFFNMMKEKYQLAPREDHNTCLIDMLGRAGRLEEAWDILLEIERKDTGVKSISYNIWTAMLAACQLHGDVELGRAVAMRMCGEDKLVSETCIALSNVYSSAGLWSEAASVRESLRRGGSADGGPGISKVEVSEDVLGRFHHIVL